MFILFTNISAYAEDEITFTDIVANGDAEIVYERFPSLSNELWKEIRAKAVYTPTDLALTPTKSRGIPGVAVFDFDNDGDVDIYVTNGPGAANSLYSNQLIESDKVSFVNVAEEAGVAAIDQDSSGVCFGDMDNDGDHDLYVLGKTGPNTLFVNLGNGRFEDETDMANLSAGNNAASSCSFGDINGDGLIDLVVANLFDGTEEHKLPIIQHWI